MVGLLVATGIVWRLLSLRSFARRDRALRALPSPIRNDWPSAMSEVQPDTVAPSTGPLSQQGARTPTRGEGHRRRQRSPSAGCPRGRWSKPPGRGPRGERTRGPGSEGASRPTCPFRPRRRHRARHRHRSRRRRGTSRWSSAVAPSGAWPRSCSRRTACPWGSRRSVHSTAPVAASPPTETEGPMDPAGVQSIGLGRPPGTCEQRRSRSAERASPAPQHAPPR
jgi:hypothetical protein